VISFRTSQLQVVSAHKTHTHPHIHTVAAHIIKIPKKYIKSNWCLLLVSALTQMHTDVDIKRTETAICHVRVCVCVCVRRTALAIALCHPLVLQCFGTLTTVGLYQVKLKGGDDP